MMAQCTLSDDWLRLLTTSEVTLLMTVHVIRIVMVAVKYGFMGRADYEVIQRSADSLQTMDLMGESKRLVVESPWSQFTRECQRFGHPPRPDK
jgi:hypothetical protein